MQAMAGIMSRVDVYVAPSLNGPNLVLTNLTGHPAVVVPNGVNEAGKSSSVSFIGKLYGEAHALLVAKAFQDATDFHLQRPTIQPAEYQR
jgi:Asp-tRNA(Asn)/Glu-tRNA(Gln) amidotransferase A subunit family amidase